MQHQRSSAHHSFFISFAGAAGQGMYSFYIIQKKEQMVPDLKERVEGKRDEGDKVGNI